MDELKNIKYRNRRIQKIKRKMYVLFLKTIITIFFILGLSLSTKVIFISANNLSEPIQYKYYKSTVVEDGDTLWEIAYSNFDSESQTIEEYIYEVKEINHLKSDHISAGEYIVLPYYSTKFQ